MRQRALQSILHFSNIRHTEGGRNGLQSCCLSMRSEELLVTFDAPNFAYTLSFALCFCMQRVFIKHTALAFLSSRCTYLYAQHLRSISKSHIFNAGRVFFCNQAFPLDGFNYLLKENIKKKSPVIIKKKINNCLWCIQSMYIRDGRESLMKIDGGINKS